MTNLSKLLKYLFNWKIPVNSNKTFLKPLKNILGRDLKQERKSACFFFLLQFECWNQIILAFSCDPWPLHSPSGFTFCFPSSAFCSCCDITDRSVHVKIWMTSDWYLQHLLLRLRNVDEDSPLKESAAARRSASIEEVFFQ